LHSSTRSSPPAVDRVTKLFPQEQVTFVSVYEGWVSAFMVLLTALGTRQRTAAGPGSIN
jgi:hypothetical protein